MTNLQLLRNNFDFNSLATQCLLSGGNYGSLAVKCQVSLNYAICTFVFDKILEHKVKPFWEINKVLDESVYQMIV